MELSDKIAVVTGGSQGIGKAIAQTFLKKEHHKMLPTWLYSLRRQKPVLSMGHFTL